MKPKSNFNQKPKVPELLSESEVVDKLLGDLDALALETNLATQDSSLLELPAAFSNLVVQPAIYITENEGQFCLIDYSEGQYEPQAIPLRESTLAKSVLASPQIENPAVTKSNSWSTILTGKKALFWGIALGVAASYGLSQVTAPSSNSTQAPVSEEQLIPVPTVTITEVSAAEIDSNLNFAGTVTAYERTPVVSQAQGLKVIDVLVERGDLVEQGQILARLDDKLLQAELLQAQASVEQSEARLDELISGSRSEEIAQAEFRVASVETTITQAELDLDLVQKRVDRNATLQAEGAISRDRLDEILNQAKVAESSLARAKADLAQEKEALRQLRAGNRDQTITQARAELAQNQGRLQAIRAQLSDTVITAPRGGLVASRNARVGQITSTAETLFSIIQDGRLELRLRVPETLVNKLELGQTVRVSSNNNSELNLLGKIREIEPLIDDTSRQATVKVELPSSEGIRPGMFLRASVNTGKTEGLAIPIKALLPKGINQGKVFILQSDNIVQAREVSVGEILSEQRVEILEGLRIGEKIVLKGAPYLKDGDKVNPKK